MTPDVPARYPVSWLCLTFVTFSLSDNLCSRLRRYRKYHDLTPKQTDRLIALCMLLSPDRLQDKYLYLSNTLCGERSNRCAIFIPEDTSNFLGQNWSQKILKSFTLLHQSTNCTLLRTFHEIKSRFYYTS